MECKIVYLLLCIRFKTLILDEVHIAVADYFSLVSYLNADQVVGLSGSLVRETTGFESWRKRWVCSFRYHVQRHLDFPFQVQDYSSLLHLSKTNRRSKIGMALKALNPFKVIVLKK